MEAIDEFELIDVLKRTNKRLHSLVWVNINNDVTGTIISLRMTPLIENVILFHIGMHYIYI